MGQLALTFCQEKLQCSKLPDREAVKLGLFGGMRGEAIVRAFLDNTNCQEKSLARVLAQLSQTSVYSTAKNILKDYTHARLLNKYILYRY